MRRPALLAALSSFALLAACSREPAPATAPPAVSPPPAAPARAAAPATTQPPPATPDSGPSWGEPDMAKVKKLFRQRFAEVKRCYEAELQKDEAARGKLTLRFTIAESGALRDVAVAKTSFARRDVPACVVEVVQRWRTPFRPAEPVEVEYPFSFTPR